MSTAGDEPRCVAEHWYSDSESTLIPADESDGPGTDGLSFCCRIEGESWEDCMRKYHEHMGWEPYRPMEGGD